MNRISTNRSVIACKASETAAAMPFDDAKAIMTGEGWERTGRTLSHAVRPISGGHLRKERLNCCQAAPTFTCDAVTLPYCVRAHGRRGSQVVRHGSAKAAFVGSIPTLASNLHSTQ